MAQAVFGDNDGLSLNISPVMSAYKKEQRMDELRHQNPCSWLFFSRQRKKKHPAHGTGTPTTRMACLASATGLMKERERTLRKQGSF